MLYGGICLNMLPLSLLMRPHILQFQQKKSETSTPKDCLSTVNVFMDHDIKTFHLSYSHDLILYICNACVTRQYFLNHLVLNYKVNC